MGLFLSKLLPALVYPVSLACLLGLAAAILAWKRGLRLVAALAGASVMVLFLSASPMTAHILLRILEGRYPPPDSLPHTTAIVLMGGAMVPKLPPRRQPETNAYGDRLLHAARLWRSGMAPWLVTTGGKIPFLQDYEGNEASSYAALLIELFGVPADSILKVDASRNSFEDARFAARLFDSRRLPKEILLVTSAFHMPRAARVFRKQGFTVHPAPTDYHTETGGTFGLFDFIPSEMPLAETAMALHEYLGLAYYKVLGRL